MQTLEKRISGMSFQKSETVARGLAQFVQEVLETSGLEVGEGERQALDSVRAVAEVLVRAGLLTGLSLDLQVATVELTTDYWQVDGPDDRDVHLLRFLARTPDKVALTLRVHGDGAVLRWLGVDKVTERSTPRLVVGFQQEASKEETPDEKVETGDKQKEGVTQ